MNRKILHPAVALSSTVAALGAALVAATPASASAPISFGYGCITSNNATNCGIGQNQFRTQVSQVGSSQILFQFLNVGSAASSITDIYFQDTAPKSLLSIANIINSTGVSFSQGATPPNLPGGQNVGFNANFSADSNSPVSQNGINPGEVLGILFNIRPGFANPFDAVITDLQQGSLRLGLHAQAFSSGASASFVNEAVPEPMTMLGTGAALGMGALLKRKSAKLKQKKAQVS
jgi:hypothetical protein